MSVFFQVEKTNVWRGDVLALRDLSLSLLVGENVAILGGNGAGKSSLLKLITGEIRAEARAGSSCRLFGEDRWNLEELRHRIGLVMPEEVARFDPAEEARDVVLSAFRGAYGRTGDMRFRAAEKERCESAMAKAGVEDLAGRFFGQLSSGEKRRFLIARALVHSPEILVLDEPGTALDFPGRVAMLNGLRSVEATVVLVTHDPGEVLPEVDRVILLKEGQVFADGPKRKILTSKNLGELYGMKLSLAWRGGWPVVR